MHFILRNRCLQLDQSTIRALSVFITEMHPSVTGTTSTKEGLSLFSLLDTTKTKPGRTLLRSWMSFPSCDKDVISARLAAVEDLHENPDVHNQLLNLLKECKDVERIVARVRSLTRTWRDYNLLAQTLKSYVGVSQIAQTYSLSAFEKFRKNSQHINVISSNINTK